MDCALIVLVYLLLFTGWFLLVGVPWLYRNIIVPFVCGVLDLLDLLLAQIVAPAITRLAEALKVLWREFWYWRFGDGEQD